MIYSFQKDELQLNSVASVQPIYAWRKVSSVPSSKKRTNYYELMYNKDHCNKEERNEFTTALIGSKSVKDHLKRAFKLAVREDYHFGGIK
eukprot:14841084-Ditylum_brightwellii.AAC.1